jgi:pimeloyl-ACP methyl ester carboxylesterase
MRFTHRAALIAAATSLAAGTFAAGASAHATATTGISKKATVGPTGPAFYNPPATLPAGGHGKLIWYRPYHGVAALRGASTYLVLYEQVAINGGLTAVSGLVSIPKGTAPAGGWPVITFAHGTTGIARACAPSEATGPASGGYEADVITAPLLDRWIKHGDAVVRTDYEGLGGPGVHPYLIGDSEGRGVLDIVTAARQLDPSISKRVVISGHSQGGHAALWAASLAPSYAPKLDVLGTVAFAPASHTQTEAQLLGAISSPALTPLAATILQGVNVAYPSLNVASLLTPAAAALFPDTLTECLNALSAGPLGSLPLNQLVSSSANIAPVIAALTANDPDGLKIKAPVLIEQGTADTTVLPTFDQELSQSLTMAGDKVTYNTWPGATHGSVLTAAAKDATSFITKLFGG